jgi:transposase-like protein
MLELQRLVKCRFCESDNIVTCGKTEQGKQRYRCHSCNRRFVLNPEFKKKVVVSEEDRANLPDKCPNCGHDEFYILLDSKSGKGEKRYSCKVCRHGKFLDPKLRNNRSRRKKDVKKIKAKPQKVEPKPLVLTKKLDINIDSVYGVPCFACSEQACKPEFCEKMDVWLNASN